MKMMGRISLTTLCGHSLIVTAYTGGSTWFYDSETGKTYVASGMTPLELDRSRLDQTALVSQYIRDEE